ncbi:glycoside hydrolase family 79 protein [Abortiporus biennis]|nr:glycoside hydrolase family 79 protein [Abortiporus biennis]
MQHWSLGFVALLSIWINIANGAVTIYGNNGVVQAAVTTTDASGNTVTTTASGSAAAAAVTDSAAFNTTELVAPALPSPAPAMQFGVPVANSAANMQGLSIPQSGSFLGFSIEMSVVTQVIGRNASFLQVPFLNLMSLVAQRGGAVHVRVGGNTQETAVLVGTLPSNEMISKDKADSSNPTETPTLLFTSEMIYMMSNISNLVNVKWYLGIPFNDTSNLRLEIAEVGDAILGENILGYQLGNEPDLYANHGHRPSTYAPQDYFNDFGVVTTAIGNDGNIPVKNNLIAPSVSGTWTPEQVWNTSFIPAYTNFLGYLAVEHYPDNNCAAAFPQAGLGTPVDPQSVFPNYLTHQSGISIVSAYLNSANIAQQAGKPFLMFETNTASCGGFPGVSDAFGSALWAVDYGLQMAYSNFSGALLHVGGTDTSYNPFTPPPTNLSLVEQWTVGPIFYSSLIVAEALGTSNQSRVVDLQMNSGNQYTPGYAIYENGNVARMVFINYMTDPTGASTYTATVSVGGQNFGESNAVPEEVTVKYLLASSVASKKNITWAGQTLGNLFEADGRFQGTESVQTVTCDQNANTCTIQVPAPGVALVFMSNSAFQESSPQSPMTFSTTSLTKTQNTATIDASVLATSNGQSGKDRSQLGGTSKGSSGAMASVIVPAFSVIFAITTGAWVLFNLTPRV